MLYKLKTDPVNLFLVLEIDGMYVMPLKITLGRATLRNLKKKAAATSCAMDGFVHT